MGAMLNKSWLIYTLIVAFSAVGFSVLVVLSKCIEFLTK